MRKYFVILFVCSSCSLFKTFDVSKNKQISAKKICLSTEGKGRLTVGEKKYVFGHESALNSELANWKLALNFPLRKAEVFELDWSENGNVKFTSTLGDKILRENKRVDPRSIELFTDSIGKLIQNIIDASSDNETMDKEFIWTFAKKELNIKREGTRFSAKFSNMVADSYFGLMQISFQDSKKQNFRMDLVIKSCFQ